MSAVKNFIQQQNIPYRGNLGYTTITGMKVEDFLILQKEFGIYEMYFFYLPESGFVLRPAKDK